MHGGSFEPRGRGPYRQTCDEVIGALGSDARSGLSERQAEERLRQYGRNELTAEKPEPAWRKFLAQFTDVLVILLLVAADAIVRFIYRIKSQGERVVLTRGWGG